MAVNFEEILNKQVDSVERPPLFPKGSYDALCLSHEFGKSSQKETPYCRFMIKLVSPRNDVDLDEFDAAGGHEKLNDRKPLRLDFYLTGDALYRLREFLEGSLNLQVSGRNFDQVIPESENVPLIVNIKHTAGSRPGDRYMEIDDTAPAE